MQFTIDNLRYHRLNQPFIDGLRPYEHQYQTLQVIREAMANKRSVCILNSSSTGSGKTLANFSASILDGVATIGVYPTNELIRDQEAALHKHLPELDVVRIDSMKLDDYQDVIQTRGHTEALQVIMGDWEGTKAILTNPDILHLMAYDLYGYSYKVNYRERLFQALINNYPIIAFDEFHLYDTKQVGNVAFIVGTIARLAPNKPHVFIFSSATPQGVHNWAKERLGLDVIDVTAVPQENGRIVAETLTLSLVSTNLGEWKSSQKIMGELWLDIHAYLIKYPMARGIFILDSVYEAKSLAASLAKLFGDEAVGEVHGYMDETIRRGSLQKRFSVGTTTIDVGVDFQDKDFMVFEARSGAQCVQRIGRLGRRGRELETINIPNYAWILMPPYAYKEVQKQTLTWQPNELISRLSILQVIEDAYTLKENFWYYWRKYSPLEAMAARDRILLGSLSDNRQEVEERLGDVILDLYDPPDTLLELQNRQRDLWREFGQVDPQIKKPQLRDRYIPEIESFRGGSDFQVAIYDLLDEAKGWPPFKIYNLPFVLRRTMFRKLTESQFERIIQEKAGVEDAKRFLRRAKRANVLGYLKIEALVEESTRFHFEIPRHKLRDKHERVCRLDGWEFVIENELQSQLDNINRQLEKRKLIAWYYQGAPWDLTATYNLPTLFQTYALKPMNTNNSTFYTVVFGLNAFLLDSVIRNTTTPFIH